MASSPDGARPRVPVIAAFVEGWRRTWRAPWVAGGMLAATLAVALPMAYVVQGAMETHLGSSLEADRALWEWDRGWVAEFGAQAEGVAQTFTQEVLGFGGTLATLSRFFDKAPLNPAIAGAVTVYIACWIFLSGGVLDRLARGRPLGMAAFFSACGGYVGRLIRLAVPMGLVYWALFRWVHPFLFTTLFDRYSANMAADSQVLLLKAGAYVIFALLLAKVNLVADMTKVRLVVEDRRSVIGALFAALRFIRRRPFRMAGLYFLNVVALLVIARLWLQVAPTATAPNWLALLVGQLYLLARIWGKLAFMASEVAFFQGELAHAQYIATPRPVWPDSAAVEAVRGMKS